MAGRASVGPGRVAVAIFAPVSLVAFLGLVAHAQSEPPPPKAILDLAKGLVARTDRDRDGALDPLEWGHARLRERNGDRGGDMKLEKDAPAELRSLDRNQDGKLTAEEYAQGPVKDEHRALDANKDGKVDPIELARFLARMDRERRQEAGLGFVERFDQDKDKKVTRAEFPGPDAVFERLDRNRDGAVDAKDGP